MFSLPLSVCRATMMVDWMTFITTLSTRYTIIYMQIYTTANEILLVNDYICWYLIDGPYRTGRLG